MHPGGYPGHTCAERILPNVRCSNWLAHMPIEIGGRAGMAAAKHTGLPLLTALSRTP